MRRGGFFGSALILSLALVGSPGCGSNDLSGSLAEAFDLTFSDIFLRRSTKAFQVTYTKSEGREVVIRVTVDLEGVDVSNGGSVNLAEEYAPGHPRAAVSRAVDGEPVRALPPVVQGDLTLLNPCAAGTKCTGSFSVRFGEGGDLGNGRTLTGVFNGDVQGAD